MTYHRAGVIPADSYRNPWLSFGPQKLLAPDMRRMKLFLLRILFYAFLSRFMASQYPETHFNLKFRSKTFKDQSCGGRFWAADTGRDEQTNFLSTQSDHQTMVIAGTAWPHLVYCLLQRYIDFSSVQYFTSAMYELLVQFLGAPAAVQLLGISLWSVVNGIYTVKTSRPVVAA